MSSHPPWNRDDDYQLKEGVEKGCSFLAMAKGAVRFSRKFTVNELKERWRVLLYDVVGSAQFAQWVVNNQVGSGLTKGGGGGSGSKLGGGLKEEGGERSGKRKVDSVRKLYYAMRKKMREESFIGGGNFGVGDCMDECCMVGNGVGEEFGFREDRGVGEFCYGDMSGFEDGRNGVMRSDCMDVISGKGLGFPVKQLAKVENDQSFEHNYAHKDVPIWKTMEDVTPPAMPVDVSTLGDRCEGPSETLLYPGDIDGDVDPAEPMLIVEGCGGGEIGSSTNINGSDMMYLSDSLLNFPNEEVPFIVGGGKDMMDETCHFLSSPMDICEDPKRNDYENKAPMSHPQSTAPGDSCYLETTGVADQSIPVQCNQDAKIDLEFCMPSSVSVCDPCSSGVHDEITECILSTEDAEIPCNDEFNPSKAYIPYALRPGNRESGKPSSSAYEKDTVHTSNHGCPAKSTNSWRKCPNNLADTRSVKPRADCGAKSEFVYGNSLDNLFTQATAVPAERTNCASNLETSISATGQMQQEEFSNGHNTTLVTLNSESGMVNVFPEHEADTMISDPEESPNDDDIPCFYDIEAMILDMDLCPENEYPDISQQVARYENEASRRRIMRLEQCVQSCTRRAIASKGAYGVFYGRHLKYYHKKTEVIIGRSTEGHDVDIDLNREGRANKISRRQALIKMEADGSFILRNLSRHEMYLNGDEITQGQAVRLVSGSLIEVKEMAFIFEINHNCVKNYLAKSARKRQESNSKFECTPEDNAPRC